MAVRDTVIFWYLSAQDHFPEVCSFVNDLLNHNIFLTEIDSKLVITNSSAHEIRITLQDIIQQLDAVVSKRGSKREYRVEATT